MVQRVTHNFIAQVSAQSPCWIEIDLRFKLASWLRYPQSAAERRGWMLSEGRENYANTNNERKRSCNFLQFFYVRATTKDIVVEDDRRQSIEWCRSFFLDVTLNNQVDANRKANGELYHRCTIVSFFKNLEKVLQRRVKVIWSETNSHFETISWDIFLCFGDRDYPSFLGASINWGQTAVRFHVLFAFETRA